MNTYFPNIGMKVYADLYAAGLVAAKIIGVTCDAYNTPIIKYEITATKNRYYKKGECLSSNAQYVIPREMVHTKNGQYRIRPFNWKIENYTVPCNK